MKLRTTHGAAGISRVADALEACQGQVGDGNGSSEDGGGREDGGKDGGGELHFDGLV
jgi:hypothetical protein